MNVVPPSLEGGLMNVVPPSLEGGLILSTIWELLVHSVGQYRRPLQDGY
jgi:hypothetical protein